MAGFIGREQALVIGDWQANTQYFRGVVVHHCDNIYMCTTDHNAGDTFYDLNWKPLLAQGGSGVPRLFEVFKTIPLEAGQSVRLSLDTTMNKYDIRTVSCTADKTGDLQISMYDRAVDGVMVYQSLTEHGVYDIVNVPCEDKDGTGKLHLIVASMIAVPATVTIRIKLTSLA